jgi:formamidopyrimidine-DNA glycosylase
MPELPEAERARQQIDRVLGREIVGVDDRDTYVCRPHAPGEMAAALVGHRLTATHRRGKFLWAETDGGPELGLHLGMAGRIVVDEPPAPRSWDRFALEFADGGRLALRDKRRLGRAVLEPDFSHVGPDAAVVGRDAFRARVGRGTAPLKARLLDQAVIAGVGNLLADETLWRARLSPRRPAGSLAVEELDRLRRELRAATRSAIRHGGVHTGDIIPFRRRGALCPRCGTAMTRATVGGRTTFWCPACQPDEEPVPVPVAAPAAASASASRAARRTARAAAS